MIDRRLRAPDDSPLGPIFLYSGFRASSTWMWSKFRAHDNLLCYYEPFNEQLGNLTPEILNTARPDGWRSHHPNGAPYALEYAGLLGDGTGVPGFPTSRGLGERYLAAAGAAGPLDKDVAHYAKTLIDHAHARGRVPLLACTRLLGQAHGMRLAFGGYHVLLIRNLFHQWNSYAGQARFGNWYFLHTLYETLELAERDSIIAFLKRFFPQDSCANFEAWVAPENFDRVFCYFIGFHLHFLTLARRSAHLVIDANALAGPDPAYRQAITARIAEDTGVVLDLADAREQVDFPLHPISDPQACGILIGEIASAIKAACDATEDERLFIDALVAALWKEHATFKVQTAGAFEYLAQITDEHEAQLKTRLQDAVQDAERQAREAANSAIVNLEVRLAEREAAHTSALEAAAHERDAAVANALEAAANERDATVAVLHETLARQQEASAEALRVAESALAERMRELATAGQEIADTRNALEEAVQAQALMRDQLETERSHVAHLEADHAAALARIAELQSMLAEAHQNTIAMRSRIDLLERSIANVDAINIKLTGRIARIEQTGRVLDGASGGNAR